MWMGERRKRIHEENPQLNFSAVSKICGNLWYALPDKSKWYAKAADAQRHYKEQLKKFYGLQLR